MEVKQGMLVRERLVFPRRGYQELRTGLLALLLGERTLLGAPGIATTSILTTRNKNATCNKGIATRSKDATNGGFINQESSSGVPDHSWVKPGLRDHGLQ